MGTRVSQKPFEEKQSCAVSKKNTCRRCLHPSSDRRMLEIATGSNKCCGALVGNDADTHPCNRLTLCTKKLMYYYKKK